MTKYKDFELKVKKTYSEDNVENKALTTNICKSIYKSITFSIKNCDPTNASGCCNSKQNCPGSTGRRK